MEGTEIDLLREAYRLLKKHGFHQRTPEEKARLESLFKRLAAFLKDGNKEAGKQGGREEKAPEGRGVTRRASKKGQISPSPPPFQGGDIQNPPLEKGGRGDFIEGKPTHSAPSIQYSELVLNVDGASKGNPGRAGAGGVLSTPEGEEVESFSLYLGVKTNNEAEYLALIEGLKLACRLRPEKLVVRSDSLLLVKQMRGEFKVKKYELVMLHLEARRHFPCKGIRFEHVPRERNAEADRMANLGVAAGLDSAERRT